MVIMLHTDDDHGFDYTWSGVAHIRYVYTKDTVFINVHLYII